MSFVPQDQALLDFYRDVHHHTLGSMPGVLTTLRKSSYRVLADCLAGPVEDLHVLDLACGDGEMIADLLAKGVAAENLTVIDASQAQIDRVKQRFPVAFRSEAALAQDLPLPDSSQDAVLCHMAFMLMRPLDEVLHELARVLKPGGMFAAVVGRAGKPEGIDLKIGHLLGPYFEAQRPDWLKQGFGDPRVLDAQGFDAYLKGFTAFRSLTQTPFKWLMSMTVDSYLDFLRRNYVWFLLKDQDKPTIEVKVRQLWQDFGGGVQQVTIPVRMMRFYKN